MPTSLHFVESEAMKLTPSERAELTERLIASFGPPQPLHPAWETEITRRLADLDAGRTQAVPGKEVLAEAEALIESFRKA
jgi:putative addiction module component (TIGR02574 family)